MANKDIFVVIDDGHGYDTPGQRTPKFEDGSYMRENDFNNNVMARLINILTINNIAAYMLCPEVDDVPLKDRYRRIKELYQTEGDKYKLFLVISIHADAWQPPEWNGDLIWTSPEGITTFYYQKDGHVSERGRTCGEYIQKELVQASGANNRSVKGKNFGILRETYKLPANATAVLCECGFMTNKKEAKKLISSKYRADTAISIYKGIHQIAAGL